MTRATRRGIRSSFCTFYSLRLLKLMRHFVKFGMKCDSASSFNIHTHTPMCDVTKSTCACGPGCMRVRVKERERKVERGGTKRERGGEREGEREVENKTVDAHVNSFLS